MSNTDIILGKIMNNPISFTVEIVTQDQTVDQWFCAITECEDTGFDYVLKIKARTEIKIITGPHDLFWFILFPEQNIYCVVENNLNNTLATALVLLAKGINQEEALTVATALKFFIKHKKIA